MDKKTLDFLVKTKREVKESKYRTEYDNLLKEINRYLVNTAPVKQTIDQSQPPTIIVTVPRGNGQNDFVTMPRVFSRKGSESDVPRSEVPIAFSKVLVASSVIAANVPDGQTFSINKIKARVAHDMWKRTWVDVEMNGLNTLDFAVQQQILTGTGMWRQYPKQVIVDKIVNGATIPKIVYDDVYREPTDMNRTWLGLSYKPFSDDNRPEVLWEFDITKEEYEKMKKRYNKRTKKNKNGTTASQGNLLSTEAQEEDANKVKTHVTITCYENPKDNRYIIASDNIVFYDGEIPNDELYGTCVVAHCNHKNFNSPYGVGVWELMRGNQATQNYVGSLSVEQVAAEIYPLVWATGTMQGDMTLKRSPNYVNVLPAGMKVEKLTTTGNSTLGMNLMERLKAENDSITGINDIVSGVSGAKTLGETVLLKEAALSRLHKPRNSLGRALEKDFAIFMSYLEQDQINPREYVFANEDDVRVFQQMNPMHSAEVEVTEEDTGEYDEFGTPIKLTSYQVMSSPKVPLSFDYQKADLEESGYEDQPVMETGTRSSVLPRSEVLGQMKEIDDNIGYDKVIMKIDVDSMLIPSVEIQKQTSMQLFPVIQNSIMTIFGMARQDPEQAKAQLKSLTKFMETQRENIFDYIPKDLYDQIMQGGMVPSPEEMMMMMGGAVGPDGAPIGQPQSPQEMPRQESPVGQAFNGGLANNGQKLGKNTGAVKK